MSAPVSRWNSATAEAESATLARRHDDERAARKAARKAQKQAQLEQQLQAETDSMAEDAAVKRRRHDGPTDDRAGSEAEADAGNKTHLHPLWPGVRIAPSWAPCRTRGRFEVLNRIQEGAYGWVSRARDRRTGDVVALKKPRLLMEGGKRRWPEGFPHPALREISILRLARAHPNIVGLREVIVGREADAVDGAERLEFATHAAEPGPRRRWNPQEDDAVTDSGMPRPIYLVLDFVEHDLYQLLRQHRASNPTSAYSGRSRTGKPNDGTGKAPTAAPPSPGPPPLFALSETKTLLRQLASALAFLHSHWILHRDIKTSNLLLSNSGQLRVADFGLARMSADPPPRDLTSVVVTLWYRPPELLILKKDYSAAIDIWSAGCVFAELVSNSVLFPGRSETDQWNRISRLIGPASSSTWPEFPALVAKSKIGKEIDMKAQPGPTAEQESLAFQFRSLPAHGIDLLRQMLSLNPADRPTAAEIDHHPFFAEAPHPKNPLLFPSFPSTASLERKAEVTEWRT